MPFERLGIFAESLESNCEIDVKVFQLSKIFVKNK